MPEIILPDGQIRHYDEPVTPAQVARDISPSLLKRAIAAVANGKSVDLDHLLSSDTVLKILTAQDAEGLDVIRHSAAHLLAQAVKATFPDVQVTIGPVIEDGFYYDFATSRPFTPEDLAVIESKMRSLSSENLPVSRRVLSHEDARRHFLAEGEVYKAEIIDSISQEETLTLYRQGDFEDLCRGPHVPSTGHIKAFKLMKVAGAYWRGDSKGPMLQRIYGTAWESEEALNAYLHRIEEAEKRDHRKLGRSMELFHFQEIAPGMVFWHPKGWTVYRLLEEYMRGRLKEFGYQEVRTPQLVDKSLWEMSGHWDNFRDEMFITETENRQYAVKPMNCPCHVQIYNQGIKSYRDLPFRLSEFGSCHRSEPSGSLHGLMRVRAMVQDDAHIFCAGDQIKAEVQKLLSFVRSVYDDFGFRKILYRLALRPEKRVGSDEIWERAENSLREALREEGMNFVDAPGEGAFYGPKIECSLADSLGRIWQCGTIQVDFSMPERLGAGYIAADGSKQIPVMIHRAILGSFERFMGILIEHHAGRFPLWLAPVQASVLTISEKQNEFATEVTDILQKQGFRAHFDLRNEKIGFKIREHTQMKVPYLLVIGDKEVEERTVSVRSREGENLGTLSISTLCERLQQEVTAKKRP